MHACLHEVIFCLDIIFHNDGASGIDSQFVCGKGNIKDKLCIEGIYILC